MQGEAEPTNGKNTFFHLKHVYQVNNLIIKCSQILTWEMLHRTAIDSAMLRGEVR